MRHLKQFTFYPGEWAPTVVSDGTLQVNLCVDALWDALELPGETGCDLIEESKYDKVDNDHTKAVDKIVGFKDKIDTLEVKIEELEDENKELETMCTRLENENETLKEQIATLLEKLNGQ